ncbi:MAG TPA: signal peptide peptidase SppA [Candidatus Nanoarchaeia archaeon]|nr:signal peptide peptidase SppA [Candidatus Nanoarchaeia archaeon]
MRNKWIFGLCLIIFLFLISYGIMFFYLKGDSNVKGNSFIVLPMSGGISIDGSGDFLMPGGVSSTQFVQKLKELEENPSVKGVIIEINSGGGSVVASEDIVNALKHMNKTTYAVVREVGASGAYWVASATDRIYASPVSMTGSIGVVGSYLEFEDLFKKYGVGYERLVAGEYKDMGTPFRGLTDDEKAIMQHKLSLIHDYFILDVARNREMSEEQVRKLANGQFYLGIEAKEYGLIDRLGNTDDALNDMKQEIGDYPVKRISEKKSILEFIGLSSYYLGKGIGTELGKKLELKNELEIKS